MQWLNELPFADNRVLQIGFLAACGIAALIVLAIFYRLAFAHRLRVPGGRTRQPRLGLVDAFSLDGQRQLVLVRRDNVEHLVMIGGPNDVLVELQINRAVATARESNQASPLLAPSAPVRRTEAPLAASAPAEAPAKVVAKAPASPPPGAADRSDRRRAASAGPGAADRSDRRRAASAGPGCAARPARRRAASARPGCADRPARGAADSRGAADPEGSRSRPGVRARSCAQTDRVRTGAPGLGSAGGDATGGARPTGAAEFAAASGGGAFPAAACDDAPADYPLQRLAESRGPGSRHGNGSRERPGQSAGPVSCRARAAAPPGETGAGSGARETGAGRRNG